MQGGLTKFRILFHCLLDGGQFRLSRSSNHVPVKADIPDLTGRHQLQLGGDKILFNHAISLIQQLQDSLLETVLVLLAA